MPYTVGKALAVTKHSMHNGFTNIYTIKHDGKMKDLIPLPPYKTIAAPTKQKKASYVLNKSDCYKGVQNGRDLVHLFTKRISENLIQQQHKALISLEDKALDLELIKPLTVDDIEINKLHQGSSSACCDVNGFYFTGDTIVDIHYCCRYHADTKQKAVRMLQPQEELRMHTTREKEQCSITTNEDIKREELQEGTLIWIHLNLLNSYEISKAFTLDDIKGMKATQN